MAEQENTQRAIYEAVKARGARGDWTAEQFAARCVAKLAEELGKEEVRR